MFLSSSDARSLPLPPLSRLTPRFTSVDPSQKPREAPKEEKRKIDYALGCYAKKKEKKEEVKVVSTEDVQAVVGDVARMQAGRGQGGTETEGKDVPVEKVDEVRQ